MKKNIFKILCLIALISIINACKDDGNFENQAHVLSPKLETLVDQNNVSKAISIGLAKPESQSINFKINFDETLINTYIQLYDEQVELLPIDNFSIKTNETIINSGDVKSDDLFIEFTNLKKLDREKTFILPIQISSNKIQVLKSSSIIFYVIKAGALINTVANMNENFFNTSKFKNPSAINDLSDFTLEALIYPRELNRLISTIMGIEDYFLLRLGDAGVDPNKLQIASEYLGNIVIDKEIQLNKWTHISVVYKKSLNNLKVYYDGKEVYNNDDYVIPQPGLTFGYEDYFYIGKSFNDNRSFNGEFSEIRIWNIARNQQDIAKSFYEVPINSTGLAAYWRINEGSGNVIKDHTPNGNDLYADKPIKWIPVQLPEKK